MQNLLWLAIYYAGCVHLNLCYAKFVGEEAGSNRHTAYASPLVVSSKTSFNWTSLPASADLKYTACYGEFECSRLEVPLDWSDDANELKAQLAIIRLPAVVPITDSSFGGTILLNPGGPGGSGIDLMRWTGHGIRSIVDDEKHFELISWDPRGVHHTTPSSSCFTDDFEREVMEYRNAVLGSMATSNATFDHKWALSQGFSKQCSEAEHLNLPDGSNVLQYTTTALTVRDMVYIIDQVERHRLNNVEILASQQDFVHHDQTALLNFWGYSYGSFLGNAFASMFPHRIGRMMLDSVVDVDDYIAAGWFSNLDDWSLGLDIFCQWCFEAREKCAWYSKDVQKPQDFLDRIHGMLEDSDQLFPLVAMQDGSSFVVMRDDIRSLLLSTMYSPQWSWPELARIFADLQQRNGTSMIPYLPKLGQHSSDSDFDLVGHQLSQKLNETVAYPPGYPHISEASHAVLCGDSEDISHMTKSDWHKNLARFELQNAYVGWKWSEIPLICVHWPRSLRPSQRNRFTGPFSSTLTDYDVRASPLLFVAGTADPVLPLKNAFKAASRHEDARVLIQDAPGHCTGYINPNNCTFHHVRRFFADGTVPTNGTRCPPDRTPWT